ncbi:spore germination protein GerPC [Robertmurraya korlensis]|uniref:spore germination protein GerPC n=1 Tax=Robertmurraya korlensis TaxID=519977 RepID=UPI00203C9348|nr:spore germination protein GerPC [Robertmurraya korlensis]MCM3602335.1 spore germination protein GerPC [Robertmurraya korlensis]
MNNEFYEYLRQLHQLVESQEHRIRALERNVLQMQKEISQLKERPPVHVDRIEYKFDQLKVESLDGTLNIGLNPSDLQGIEDFSVPNQSIKTPSPPKQMFQRTMELEDIVYEYMGNHLPAIFEKTQAKLQTNLDDSYYHFIEEDIKKQIPKRIEHYLREFSSGVIENEDRSRLEKMITDQFHKEMEHGVEVFIKNLPENVKGMKQE